VTVIVELPLPAVIGDVAPTVDCAADTVPGFTTTVAVCVTATPLIVADTVFDSAAVELRVPVATPLAFVVALGCVTVFPTPGALRMTVAPATVLPNASGAVAVVVDVPLPPAVGDGAAKLDCAAETVVAVPTTVRGRVPFDRRRDGLRPGRRRAQGPRRHTARVRGPERLRQGVPRRRRGRERHRGALDRVAIGVLRRHGDGRGPAPRGDRGRGRHG